MLKGLGTSTEPEKKFQYVIGIDASCARVSRRVLGVRELCAGCADRGTSETGSSIAVEKETANYLIINIFFSARLVKLNNPARCHLPSGRTTHTSQTDSDATNVATSASERWVPRFAPARRAAAPAC